MPRKYTRKPIEDRFWEKVEKTSNCWHWIAATNNNGYGVIGSGGWHGRSILAHRLSYEIHSGPIPEGSEVCHHCDNPQCVNPDHLFLGSHAENLRDAAKKGRFPRGNRHHASKLSEYDVLEIRELAKKGLSSSQIASRFNVNRRCISNVIARKSWKHVA